MPLTWLCTYDAAQQLCQAYQARLLAMAVKIRDELEPLMLPKSEYTRLAWFAVDLA